MFLALDSNVFIAFLARDADFFAPASVIMEQVMEDVCKVTYSSLVFGEVLRMPPQVDALAAVEHFFDDLGGLDYSADRGICNQAGVLRRRYPGLKLPDAIHLATALAAKADQFVTADQKLLSIAQREMPATYLKDFR